MPRTCNCGGSRSGGTGQKFDLVDSTNKVINTYSSETDARQAASQQPGTRVRPR
jgi:hypothetical protein